MDLQWVQIVSLIVSTLSIPTIAALIWKELYEKKKAERNEIKELKNQENVKTIREIIKEEITSIENKIDKISENLGLVSKGTLSGLRNDILKSYYDCVEKGYRTQDDSENFREMYQAYKNLGGNSFIDEDIVPSFEKIALKPNNFKKEKKETK